MRKVLVVDDDPSLRRLMRLELGDTYEVIDSGEPEQGLALALEHKPDAILVDLRMPKYSGFELVQTYTSFSQTQNVPVVIVSGEAGSQTKEQCRKLGAVGYFEKPIDFEALRACLAQLMKKQQRYTPRVDVRVLLGVPLKLKGADDRGNKIEAKTFTESVSLSGFQCTCTAAFAVWSTLDVYLSRDLDVHVGKAQLVRVKARDGIRECMFRFAVKPKDWVLK
jgi:CheY-like chemotaxis protein